MSPEALKGAFNAKTLFVTLVAATLVSAAGLGALPGGLLTGGNAVGAGVAQEQPATAIGLTPSNAEINVSETMTYDVVVADTAGGVGAYDFTVSVEDSTVATITDVELRGGPPEKTTDVTLDEDGASATVLAALADTDDDSGVTIATVTVEGVADGQTDLSLVVNALGTEAGRSYTVTETNDASLTVRAVDDGDGDDGTGPSAPENAPPTADAGSDRLVDDGVSVRLDASGSSDPDGDSLGYTWTQTVGPMVTLSDANSATPSFTAPSVKDKRTLTFVVEISDGNGGVDTDTVDVTVRSGSEVESSEPESGVSYYQVDFVGGEPIDRLGPADSNNFYADQERLVRYLQGSSDDPVTFNNNASAYLALDDCLRKCVTSDPLTVSDGEATVRFTVADDCEGVTLSLVSYQKPGPGFDRETAHQQVLVDSETETFGPGEHTLTVSLPDDD